MIRRQIALIPLATIIGLATCSPHRPSVSARNPGADFQEREVTAVITSALEQEAAGIPADTLFMPSALVVVNGRTRQVSPLFAGMGIGGQISITSSQLEIRPNSSWGVVDYRWQSQNGHAREGRATFVLTQIAPGRWRIQHVHSSSPE